MTLGESIESCFRNYVTFRGRASRSEYWYFVLFLVLVGIGLGMVDAYIGADGPDYGGHDGYGGYGGGPQSFGLFGSLFTLATFLPALAVAVRRLHDIDFRGWWLLLSLTMIGIIPLIVMLCWRPSQGDNRFGPPPARGAAMV